VPARRAAGPRRGSRGRRRARRAAARGTYPPMECGGSRPFAAAPTARLFLTSQSATAQRSRVRFWEQNGSGGTPSGTVRSGHRTRLDASDVQERRVTAASSAGALSSHRGAQRLDSRSASILRHHGPAEYVPSLALSAASDQLRASLIARLQDGRSACWARPAGSSEQPWRCISRRLHNLAARAAASHRRGPSDH